MSEIPEVRFTFNEEEKLFTANLSDLLDLPMNHYPLRLDLKTADSVILFYQKDPQERLGEQENYKLISTPYISRDGYRLTIFHDCDFDGRKNNLASCQEEADNT